MAARSTPAAFALLWLAAGCPAAPPVPTPPPAATPAPLPAEAPPEEEARAALVAFLEATREGRLEEAYGLLTERWRARATPERLRADLAEAGSLGSDRLERARLAASAAAVLADGAAAFPIGDGRAVRLRREPSGWKIDALE